MTSRAILMTVSAKVGQSGLSFVGAVLVCLVVPSPWCRRWLFGGLASRLYEASIAFGEGGPGYYYRRLGARRYVLVVEQEAQRVVELKEKGTRRRGQGAPLGNRRAYWTVGGYKFTPTTRTNPNAPPYIKDHNSLSSALTPKIPNFIHDE